MTHPDNRSYHFFASWATFSYSHALWIILTAIFLTTLGVLYTAQNLGVYTDTTDMLSEDIPFRINHEQYKKKFPQHSDTMLLVLDGPTPEQVHTATKHLTTRLKKDTTNFHDVHYEGGEHFLEKNGLLYKSIPELNQITDRLAAAQPLVNRISDNPSLFTFFTVLTEAIKELREGRKLELKSILQGVQETIDARLSDTPRALSWQVLFDGNQQKNSYQEFVLVQPKMDFSQLFAAKQPIDAIRTTAQEIGITHDSAVQLRITGEAALAYDELNSAMLGAQNAGFLALAMVAIVLFVALRHAGSVLIVILSLILGLLLTATFATIAVGHLNLISIAFAVLYIGLGVDYAIHFLLRYEELYRPSISISETIYAASGNTGRALMICAITTAIGFYAFMPTDYRGVAELGLISGTGMLISLIVTLTIVPALQRYLPTSLKYAATTSPLKPKSSKPWIHKIILFSTAVAAVASVIAIQNIKFDYNLLNLNDPNAESVETFQELLTDAEDSPSYLVTLASNEREVKRIVKQLKALPEVDKVITLFDLIPTDQIEKLFFIEEMALTMGPTMLAEPLNKSSNTSQEQSQAILEELISTLNQFIAEQPDHIVTPSAQALSTSLSTVLTQILIQDTDTTQNTQQLLNQLSHDLIHLLPNSLERLYTAFNAQSFTQQDLPASLRAHWEGQNQTYRVAIYPAENIGDNNALREFVRSVQKVSPNVTGAPVISLEAGEAVVSAFMHAFTLALIGVILALLILLRNIKATLLVLTPLLLAALFTGAFTALLNIPFNFANIIALPLLLGIGIDCSVHMVHRSLNTDIPEENLLHTSTTRAIFYSTLTTLAGFGSLIFSTHQGTASMGLLLTIGVLLTLICVLVILPALLHTARLTKHLPAKLNTV